MPKIPKYETKLSRLIVAILIGSALGGFITALLFVSGSSPTDIGTFFAFAAFVSTKWITGILIFGAPVWFFLHKLGWREWYVAVVAGALIPVIRFMILVMVFSNSRDFTTVIKISSMFSPIGMIVSLVIWLIAYRRIERIEAPILSGSP